MNIFFCANGNKIPARTKTYFVMLLVIFFSRLILFAQQNNSDSLLNVLKSSSEDTNKVNTLNLLAKESMSSGDFEKGIYYADEAKKLEIGRAHV